MIPLHILALAQKPVIELLGQLLLLLLSGFDVARTTKDFFGSTVLEYLSKNPLEEGRHATRWLANLLVGQQLPFLRLDRWKHELLAEEERVVRASDLGISSNEVQSFLDKLVQLEFLEMLLELKLWKIKLDENPMEENREKVKENAFRHSCRVSCGISIVVEHVIPFLGNNHQVTVH
ncbi:unnamed protein product [Cylindrotheca closterium]|uniref:Uncharacterized protein n=1 Tax=Cylindrotheca closterium TaxID=2856 RepID=A0AAD2CRR6_9STRA|nr:unnamed protein product [Cylindrotheca closterium]